MNLCLYSSLSTNRRRCNVAQSPPTRQKFINIEPDGPKAIKLLHCRVATIRIHFDNVLCGAVSCVYTRPALVSRQRYIIIISTAACLRLFDIPKLRNGFCAISRWNAIIIKPEL